jgi:hypothetical protein
MAQPSQSSQRTRSRVRSASDPDDRTPVDVDDLAAAADGVVEEEPTGRSFAQVAVAAVVCAVVLTLLVITSSQWVRSAFLDFAGRTPCTHSDCVEFSLARIEASTGVTFPTGTTVASSTRSKAFLDDEWSVGFEVHIPAGLPVPDAPQPWQSEPHPETGYPGYPGYVEILIEQGLEEVRWSQGMWITGVKSNGVSIVQGNFDTGPGSVG